MLTHVLPRHGRHVRSLNIPSFEYDEDDVATDVSDDDLAHDEYVAALEELPTLLARAIGCMPKLVRVRYYIYQLDSPAGRSPNHTESGSSWGTSADTVVTSALVAIGPRLVDFEIYGEMWNMSDDAFDWDEGAEVAAFLSHFPSLSRLYLHVYHCQRGRTLLLSSLFSLHCLTRLEIRSKLFVEDEFAAISWACPLETLAFPESLSFPSMFTFLSNFSATLKKLSLYPASQIWRDNELTVPALGRRFPLPHLHTLEIATSFESQILDSFFH